MKTASPLLLCIMFIFSAIQAPVLAKQAADARQYRHEQLLEGLGVAWGLCFLSDNEVLLTERAGSIKHYNIATRKLRIIKGAPKVRAEGQGGLLDVAVPPDYAPGEWIYFTFVRDHYGDGVTVLARARLQGDTMADWQDLLETQSATTTDFHYGSRIAFDHQGYVYFGVGDRGKRPMAQDLSNHVGSILRLHRDGRVPKDNPFVGRKGVLPEIWSYGHRNPQGIAFDPVMKRLWVIEHGPRGGDEINLILPGRNYGWPVISYGKEYWGPVAVGEGTHREGMEQPVKQYTPSIAPGSLIWYSGRVFSAWKGNLLAGALKLHHLNRVQINDRGRAVAEQRLLGELDERIRAVAEGPDGLIYLTTDSGRLLRVSPPSQ